jgi:ParB family transcriptional regulator, chromosome partitioning protein
MVARLQDVSNVSSISLLRASLLLPNPLNPRGEVTPESVEELTDSIRERGILQPLLVTPHDSKYLIVAGHRRHAAARLAGLSILPCIVHTFSEREQLELMIVENVQREDLTPMQEARAYQRLLADGGTKAEVARRLGLPLQRITSRLVLLDLDQGVQRVFDRQELPLGLAKSLSTITEPKEQRRVAALALQRRLNLDQLDDFIRSIHRREPEPRQPRQARARRASAEKPAVMPSPQEDLTRSEAVRLLSGTGEVSFSVLLASLEGVCDGCDEEHFPEICRACPLPHYIASIVRRATRDA